MGRPFHSTLLACLWLLCLQAVAQPSIRFDTNLVDLGTIPKGAPAYFHYPFTNTGPSTLVITSVKSSCGCVVPSFNYQPVPPGGRGVVSAQYDSNRIGPCHKTLSVVSNDSLNPLIRLDLRCNVIASGPPLEFRKADPTLVGALPPQPSLVAAQPAGGLQPSLPVAERADPSRPLLPGSAECRPVFTPPAAGSYALHVYNPNGVTVRMNVASYSNPSEGRYGAFLSMHLPASQESIASGWGRDYVAEMDLPAKGACYLVVHDRAWLAEHVFKGVAGDWAMPIGVTWIDPTWGR